MYREPADYVAGRLKKPRQMYYNSARTYEREHCGPQARFWEARRYPAWVWMVGSITAGSIITVAYIAFHAMRCHRFSGRFFGFSPSLALPNIVLAGCSSRRPGKGAPLRN